MKPTILKITTLLLASLSTLHSEDTASQREQVLELAKLTTAPATQPAEGFAAEGGLKAIFVDTLSWKGKPTKAFAWLGLPEKRSGKVPGMVLVHGGGGTAEKEWVKKWTQQGYAAISMGVEGQTSMRDPANAKAWKQHAWPGPQRNGIYGDSAQPLSEQWMYHAVADTVLANSLLRSMPEVDADKIGIMGVSWGGVITSTVIGIDLRFAFAIPTYGCGHLFDADNIYGRTLGKNALYREVWDPMVRMDRVKIPVMWFSWPEDQHFPLDCLAASYRSAPGPHMLTLIPKMGHGHGAAYNPPDSYAFAESIVREGRPWCVQSSAKVENGAFRVEFTSSKVLDRALLISTVAKGFTGQRPWVVSSANLEKSATGWTVAADLPEGTTAWFVNAHSGKLTVSSDYQEPTSPTITPNGK